MTQEQRVSLYEAWTAMDQASQRILTAQPATMTGAAERLEAARVALREIVMNVTA